MECLELNAIEYKGTFTEMQLKNFKLMHKGKKVLDQTESTSQNDTKKSQEELLKKLFSEYEEKILGEIKTKSHKKSILNFATFTLALLAAFGSLFLFFDNKFTQINESINKCLKIEDINDTQNQVSKMYEDIYFDGGIQSQLRAINEKLDIKVIAIPDNDNESSSAIKTSVGTFNNSYYASASTEIKRNTIIGLDVDQNQCIAEDFIDKTILLTYKENDKEVYFLGQYNKNYNWNKYCITNTYDSDGSLLGICESNFENGKRLDYISFYLPDTSSPNKWTYSNRQCSDDGNIGTTVHYNLTYDKIKNFTNTNVRITDILYIDKFIETHIPTMVTYYHGNTSKQQYNDTSGQAYEAIYYEDGTIKTLYVGEFVDGTFVDFSNDAWDIAYVEGENHYVRNTGNFNKGHALKKSTIPISIDEITDFISEYEHKNKFKFECELNWRTN